MLNKSIFLTVLTVLVVGCGPENAANNWSLNSCQTDGYEEEYDVGELTAEQLLSVMDDEYSLNGIACRELCEMVELTPTTDCEIEIDEDFGFDDTGIEADEVVAIVECYEMVGCG